MPAITFYRSPIGSVWRFWDGIGVDITDRKLAEPMDAVLTPEVALVWWGG